MQRAAKKWAEAAQKVLSELPLPTRKNFALYKHDPTANQRKAPAIHEPITKLPKLSPMDLS